MIESEGSSAIGRTDSWPWSGSLIRPEMKDDAADDGFYQHNNMGLGKTYSSRPDCYGW
jgi:hypothetical protein